MMGIYLNPGNSGFTRIVNSDYVDKTGLIGLLNRTVDTTRNLTCISRPRRFGKSYAAQMLCAYYDKTCDSSALFEKYAIARDQTYKMYLNRYDVIYLDMTGIIGETSLEDMVAFAKRNILEEIKKEYPQVRIEEGFAATLVNLTELTKNKIVMIIDEWDAPIREAKDYPQIQKEYLEFLRSLFKNSGTTSRLFAAAYMTGILPIKKDGSQSAISDFREYSMVKPRQFGPYVGFTEEEVLRLCAEHHVDFQTMKEWYDGYYFKDAGSIYNPNSVMQALENNDFDSYWTETSAADGLMDYISRGYSGLTKTIAELIGGVEVRVNTSGFANDLTTFKGRDDVLTLLIHLGYLAYNSDTKTVHIPNEEIKLEFQRSIREADHSETIQRLEESDRLFMDTLLGNEEAVAAQIEKVHAEETSPLHYNREDSLRSVIKLAYYTYRDHYLQWEELPAGEGYADVVYLPRPDSEWPVLVIELKWNHSADTAINQILERKYPSSLQGYRRRILLVGINYDRDAPPGKRKHTCKIVSLDPPSRGSSSKKDISGSVPEPEPFSGSVADSEPKTISGSISGPEPEPFSGSVSDPEKQSISESAPVTELKPVSNPVRRQNRAFIRSMLLAALHEKGNLSMNELAAVTGYARLTNTIREVIHEMLESGEVRYLIPEKPRSRNQKICLVKDS